MERGDFKENSLYEQLSHHTHETGGNRLGSLSLRNQRFTAHMLDVLRTDRVTVKLTLPENGKNSSRSQGIATAPVNEFVYLRASVKNQSSKLCSTKTFFSFLFFLAGTCLIVSTDEELIVALNITIAPGEYVLFDGMMSNVPVGRVKSGETRHMDFGFCFVTEGLFDVRATVAIVTQRGSTTSRTGEGGLRVLVGKGV